MFAAVHESASEKGCGCRPLERQRRIFDGRRPKEKSGAPRPMKMGTTASPWRYDGAADHALRPDNLRRPPILHYLV
jgi:hypothetical protein